LDHGGATGITGGNWQSQCRNNDWLNSCGTHNAKSGCNEANWSHSFNQSNGGGHNNGWSAKGDAHRNQGGQGGSSSLCNEISHLWGQIGGQGNCGGGQGGHGGQATCGGGQGNQGGGSSQCQQYTAYIMIPFPCDFGNGFSGMGQGGGLENGFSGLGQGCYGNGFSGMGQDCFSPSSYGGGCLPTPCS
jgi:hypothetical protein